MIPNVPESKNDFTTSMMSIRLTLPAMENIREKLGSIRDLDHGNMVAGDRYVD